MNCVGFKVEVVVVAVIVLVVFFLSLVQLCSFVVPVVSVCKQKDRSRRRRRRLVVVDTKTNPIDSKLPNEPLDEGITLARFWIALIENSSCDGHGDGRLQAKASKVFACDEKRMNH